MDGRRLVATAVLAMGAAAGLGKQGSWRRMQLDKMVMKAVGLGGGRSSPRMQLDKTVMKAARVGGGRSPLRMQLDKMVMNAAGAVTGGGGMELGKVEMMRASMWQAGEIWCSHPRLSRRSQCLNLSFCPSCVR